MLHKINFITSIKLVYTYTNVCMCNMHVSYNVGMFFVQVNFYNLSFSSRRIKLKFDIFLLYMYVHVVSQFSKIYILSLSQVDMTAFIFYICKK